MAEKRLKTKYLASTIPLFREPAVGGLKKILHHVSPRGKGQSAGLRASRKGIPGLDGKGERVIGTLQTSDMAALRKSVEKKSLSPQTVKHVPGLVRRVLRWGVRHNLCKMPDNLVFEMPHVDNQKTATMTGVQLSAYLRVL